MGKVEVGDKFLRVADSSNFYTKGVVYKVTRVDGEKIFLTDNRAEHLGTHQWYESSLLEKFRRVENVKPTKNQRITKLENEMSELKLIVEQLRENNITIEDVEKHFGKPSTDEDVVAKTPNELRAEIIEKAKTFVESLFKEHWNDSGDLVVSHRLILHTVEFVVNEEKRQINALLRSYGKRGQGMVDYNGKAKCNPSDVFNEHIGKAIALGRALGLDVSEFEQAVQPNELALGQLIKNDSYEASEFHNIEFVVSEPTTGKGISYDDEFKNGGRRSAIDSSFARHSETKIINDTNAIYEINE